jgi:glycosyltransferase involved in cell wall biosynthesis
MKISFIIPSRNNLKYLKWGYDAIQKNKGEHEVEICYADDDSSDGTWEWLNWLTEQDENVKIYRNTTGKRQGHTILYDKLVNDLATNDICMIYHADMYLCPGALDAIEKNLKEKTIVSLTRIEPPLHPPGPEKILWNGGVEPEEFTEDLLLEKLEGFKKTETTEGIFAPWAFWKKDFQEIGGHDPLYRPQSKEDSDIFNRFQLNGIKFVQTWKGFVYHMTCRGSRRNTVDKAKNIYEDSPEWLEQNMRSTRNFIRKWGSFVKHDKYMKPIIPNKYNIGIKITNCNLMTLKAIEIYADDVYFDDFFIHQPEYIKREQPNTDYNLADKLHNIEVEPTNDIVVEFDANRVGQQEGQYLQMLSEIFDQGVEPGTFELGALKITINKVKHYTDDLIKLETPYNTNVTV